MAEMQRRYVGVDIGAETIKLVELLADGDALRWTRRALAPHHKSPGPVLLSMLEEWGWSQVTAAMATGRLGRLAALPRVPVKQALAEGFRFLHEDRPATVVSIGSHGFAVLELRETGVEVFRENSRCSQGTGNFLRQLVERFDLTVEEASRLCADVEDPAPLSGRCPVILKTDMTHLANRGESRACILAGLYDAVCENVQVLLNPRTSPSPVLLIGGVTQAARIQAHFGRFLARHGMELLPTGEERMYMEALGSALLASRQEAGIRVPPIAELLAPRVEHHLEQVDALASWLPRVRRMSRPPLSPRAEESPRDLILGFDIGSTGSKVVALDLRTRELIWQAYVNTSGDPVGAAQTLMRRFADGPAAQHRLRASGTTGSGREIVGSLLATCYGVETVFVLNEIAAHAEGALSYDSRVDTIFEIGGQDAKYIRLSQGRVVDSAMNEACSAGTGSFIEEQGRKLGHIRDVVHLGEEALQAPYGVSLGQHCSVFMAEIIDEAVAAGVEQRAIIAGIYDSIIQNYLNRVKGTRSVGQVIFCQGMPFSSDALAAAVARQTGSEVIVPPDPGTVGSLGIALLALQELELALEGEPLDPQRFLDAQVVKKDTFICQSTRGCGGTGNRCRIDRLTTLVQGSRSRFTWGGGCSLHDQGTGRRKLPDRTPDPFRARQALLVEVTERVRSPGRGPRVVLTDQFLLNGLLPFFATFLHGLGLDVEVHRTAGRAELRRGIEEATVPYCAPMQLYHGVICAAAETQPDFLFLPMLRTMPRVQEGDQGVLCPVVQGSPDVMSWLLPESVRPRVISPVVDVGEDSFRSLTLRESMQGVALQLGRSDPDLVQQAYEAAVAAQETFDSRCLELGQEALDFAATHGITPVVVLGRSYTIHNEVLNSNVPTLLREQGALAIPVDCYPVAEDVPLFGSMYWGYGQRNLRAAHQVRRTPGTYAIWCSNYSCGPDSFSIHFFGYILEGKPFCIIETDGHSGDAGTKTRIEAFLHCVREDLQRSRLAPVAVNRFEDLHADGVGLAEIRERGDLLLIPRMGISAEAVTAALRSAGVRAECLPTPNREAMRLGRRHTSGKECVPMCITLGSLLQRIEQEEDPTQRFSFLMPTTSSGPCRFGVYNLLHKIVLRRQGWQDRVRVWSPADRNYFDGVRPGLEALIFTGIMAMDLLQEAYLEVRAVERERGAAAAIFERHRLRLLELLERTPPERLSLLGMFAEVLSGRVFGTAALLEEATRELAQVREDREVPTVMVTGEIYVRLDPFANDGILDKLFERGIRARLVQVHEWIEYTDYLAFRAGDRRGLGSHLSAMVKRRIQSRLRAAMCADLGMPRPTSVEEAIEAAAPYVRQDLQGEAVLTVGGPLHEWRNGQIDGVVSVGPLECMPNKIAEAQLFQVAEQEDLASLTIPLNGDPVDVEVIESFAFEVHSRFRRRVAWGQPATAPGR